MTTRLKTLIVAGVFLIGFALGNLSSPLRGFIEPPDDSEQLENIKHLAFMHERFEEIRKQEAGIRGRL